jgi:2-polyprenyl-3-methyl-5-hydroxy-6-metoxy-1,4-benzoquinol methylase
MRKAPERADFLDRSQAGFFGDHAARYEYAAHYVRDKRVIDAACGTGYGTGRLRLAGARECLGIDVDAETIARVQVQYRDQGVQYMGGDCESFDFAAHRPDVVVSFETIEHLQKPELFLDGVRRGLAHAGMLIVSCPNDEELGDHNPYHLQSWDADAFRTLLSRYFESVLILGQVETPASKARYDFGRYLDDQVGMLRSQPWTRAWRRVRGWLGRAEPVPRPEWSNFVPGQHDWWFVPSTGPEAMSLLAVCRSPRSD